MLLIATMRMIRSGMPTNQCPPRARRRRVRVELSGRRLADGSRRAQRGPHASPRPGPVRSATNCSCSTRQPDGPRQGPSAVADPALAADQHGPVAAGRRLQGRGELAGVQRVDAGVALEHREQRGRVRGAVDDAVVRRVAEQPAELRRVVGVAVLLGPRHAEAEPLVADHVEQRRRAHDGREQVGPLRQGRADQQAAVGAAPAGQLVRGGPALRDEVVADGVEVVEHVLLVRAHARAVPLLALLAAAAQVGDDVHAARLDPRERRRGERGVERDLEPAVAVEDRRRGGERAAVVRRARRCARRRTRGPSCRPGW